MYTPKQAEVIGKTTGDEFLCDLDVIEQAENSKGQLQGNTIESAYESASDSDQEPEAPNATEDRDFLISGTVSKTRSYYLKRSERKDVESNDEIDKFVLDPKFNGNIGRFFNHSCEPNMTTVNAFTFTQDLRFPVLSFFTNRTVSPGEELSWSYGSNYGTNLPDHQRIPCMCGASNCAKENISFKKINYDEKGKH